MNVNFEDSSLVVHYIQQFLNENYNSGIYVNSRYYESFDMNYGFAHYVAKYLERTFPVLDEQTKQEYLNPIKIGRRDLKKPISILNYFLCNNDGNTLRYNDSMNNSQKTIYNDIYNNFMMVHWDSSISMYKPIYGGKYMINNDLPLFTSYTNGTYTVNQSSIFQLSPWTRSKNICELDDLVVSFLLGRTITPNSTMEEIYYVQKLLIKNRELYKGEKGNWNFVRPDGTTLTDTIMNFQRSCTNNYGDVPILVTGYFDIFTEQRARMNEIPGGVVNVHGL